ncbi:MAG: PAS domain-containing protein [Hyphomicrobiales bacterium]
MLVNENNDVSQDETQVLHPSSRSLFRFWEQIRAEQSAPRRDQLDLGRIRTLVPNLFIATFDQRAGLYRWRLAGTGICRLLKREVTGENLLAQWDGFDTDVASRYLGGVIRGLQPCLIRFRLQTDLHQMLGAELVGLPLVAADGTSIHVFGGVFPFRDPDLLGYASIDRIEMSGARSIWTEHLPGDQLLAQTQIAPEAPIRNFHVIPGGRSPSN